MLLTYKEAIKKENGRYGLTKAVKNKRIKRVARNLYSTNKNETLLDATATLFPKAIITGESALYYHGLIDKPPDYIDLASKRGGTKISNPAFHQTFIPLDWLEVGREKITYDGAKLNIYNLERMLLELMRNRNKLPYDIYKEAIVSYRKIADKIDIYKLEDYANEIPRGQHYLKQVLERVF